MVLNASAGPGHAAQTLERLQAHFDEAGVRVCISQARNGDELGRLAGEAMRKRPALLIAGGGDGTLSAVADVTRGTGTALGILPLGTYNHFARDLGIPLDLAQAVRTAIHGKRTLVDVGELNGACFLNNASLGIYPVIVRRRDFQQRQLGRAKFSATLWAIWSVMRRSPFMRLRIALDGEERAWRAPFVFIGNNAYNMQGFGIGTRERIDCGTLSVYSTPRGSRYGLLKLALHALFGRLEQSKDFFAMSATEVRVESSRPRLRVGADGEVRLLQTPLELRVVPRSLLVMAPPGSAP